MKNILKLAVFAVFMTFPQLSYAVENAQVVLDLKPETEEKAPAVGLLLDEYLAEVADFDAKYPGEQIEEDFKDDIRELHPEYGDSGINTKETLIRLGVRTKRIYNFLLEKVKSFIATSDIPLILSESAYESGDEETYIESDAPVVIQDFKKIIAYSRSERDRRAYQDKQRREQGGLRQSERDEELKKAFLQGDWKKVFLTVFLTVGRLKTGGVSAFGTRRANCLRVCWLLKKRLPTDMWKERCNWRCPAAI